MSRKARFERGKQAWDFLQRKTGTASCNSSVSVSEGVQDFVNAAANFNSSPSVGSLDSEDVPVSVGPVATTVSSKPRTASESPVAAILAAISPAIGKSQVSVEAFRARLCFRIA